jgi:hypothetical protein
MRPMLTLLCVSPAGAAEAQGRRGLPVCGQEVRAWALTPRRNGDWIAHCVVCCRSSSPRFQIFVNNRLSTTNMTLPLDENLVVDNVDSFLILRSPDTVSEVGCKPAT